jgi:hypothetical protein
MQEDTTARIEARLREIEWVLPDLPQPAVMASGQFSFEVEKGAVG